MVRTTAGRDLSDLPASSAYHPIQSLASLFLSPPMNALSTPLSPTAHPPSSRTPNATSHSCSACETTVPSSSPDVRNISAVCLSASCFSASWVNGGGWIGGFGSVREVAKEDWARGMCGGRASEAAGVWVEGRRRVRM